MEFRWLVFITLWTLLAGPVFDAPVRSGRISKAEILHVAKVACSPSTSGLRRLRLDARRDIALCFPPFHLPLAHLSQRGTQPGCFRAAGLLNIPRRRIVEAPATCRPRGQGEGNPPPHHHQHDRGRLGPSDQLAVGRRDRRRPLLRRRPPPRPEEPDLAGARPLHPQQGPRGAAALRRARRGRLLSRRSAADAAQARQPARRPSEHAPAAGRRGVHRLARPGAVDRRRPCARGPARRLRLPRLRPDGRRRDRRGPGLGSGHVRRTSTSSTIWCAIVDQNGYQQTGPTAEVLDLRPLAPRWEAFGWFAQEINGHDLERGARGAREGEADQGQAQRHRRPHGQGLSDPGRC